MSTIWKTDLNSRKKKSIPHYITSNKKEKYNKNWNFRRRWEKKEKENKNKMENKKKLIVFDKYLKINLKSRGLIKKHYNKKKGNRILRDLGIKRIL